MISYKCEFCGGEMTISPSGDCKCGYCGSKSNFSDAQLREYREFRRNMLLYLSAVTERRSSPEEEELLWERAGCETFVTEDGRPIQVNYLFRAEEDGIEMFFAKGAVLYVFPKEFGYLSDQMLQNINLVQYPSADMKDLPRLIPTLSARLKLSDGGVLMAFRREPAFYPLGSFGSLPYEHAAWILSRLENLCCLLEYSGLRHNGITPDAVYIDPINHEAALYGGWWNTRQVDSVGTKDLLSIRRLCLRLLGENADSSPKPFLDFLKSAPREDAYRDFARWDEVIEKELGGRKFARFTEK